VADEIGRALNAKVDEIRRTSSRPGQDVATGGTDHGPASQREADSGGQAPKVVGEVPAARFLTGMAPAAGAAERTSSLGDGSRTQADRAAALSRTHGPGESARR
jgi:hypothetical protein